MCEKTNFIFKCFKFYKNIKVVNDYNLMLKNKSLDVIFISTRHNDHWQLTKNALLNKKHVFCEKPLCIKANELKEIKSFFIKQKVTPVLVTGFNRRFSDSAKILKGFIEKSTSPIFLNYTVNADKLLPNSYGYILVREEVEILERLVTFMI